MSYYADETSQRGGPPPGEPPVNFGRLWAGGLATAVVAALIALVGVLIARAVAEVALYAPPEAGAFGDVSTAVLCLSAAGAALAATGLAHVLLLGTPRPLSYFSWIVGLVTVAVVVVPFLTAGSRTIALAVGLIHGVIGLAIGSLVSGAAASASRPARSRQRQRFEIDNL